MKLFLKRTVSFLLAVAAFVAVVVVGVGAVDLRSYYRSLKAPEGVDVLVCNDSQSARALDPAGFPRMWNKSSVASPCTASYMRLRDALAHNPNRFKCVVIDVSQVHIGMDDRTQPLCCDGQVSDHAILELWNILENPRRPGSFGGLFTGLFLKHADDLRSALRHGKPYVAPICGGYRATTTAGFKDHPEAALADLRKKARPTALMRKDERCVWWFRKMAECAVAAGAKPVFMTTPLHPKFREHIDPDRLASIVAVARDLAAEFKTVHLNYLCVDFDDGCWQDCNHLNSWGARKFTKRFRKDIEGLKGI